MMLGLIKDGFNLTKKIVGVFKGNKVVDAVRELLPPDIPPEQKAKIEIGLKELDHKIEMESIQLGQEIQNQFFEYTKDMEGTANDLKQMGWLGRIVIFYRGILRPAIITLVMYFDYLYFAEGKVFTEKGMTLLTIMNLLTLVTLFGERAVKNLMPLIVKLLGVKNGK